MKKLAENIDQILIVPKMSFSELMLFIKYKIEFTRLVADEKTGGKYWSNIDSSKDVLFRTYAFHQV